MAIICHKWLINATKFVYQITCICPDLPILAFIILFLRQKKPQFSHNFKEVKMPRITAEELPERQIFH